MTHKMSQSGYQGVKGVASGRYPPSYLEYLSLWDLKNIAHVESFGKFVCVFVVIAGVSILMSYGENPHYVKLPIFSEFMGNSTKFMKNSRLISSKSLKLNQT